MKETNKLLAIYFVIVIALILSACSSIRKSKYVSNAQIDSTATEKQVVVKSETTDSVSVVEDKKETTTTQDEEDVVETTVEEYSNEPVVVGTDSAGKVVSVPWLKKKTTVKEKRKQYKIINEVGTNVSKTSETTSFKVAKSDTKKTVLVKEEKSKDKKVEKKRWWIWLIVLVAVVLLAYRYRRRIFHYITGI